MPWRADARERHPQAIRERGKKCKFDGNRSISICEALEVVVASIYTPLSHFIEVSATLNSS
jgi:hypothetical protein